MPDVQNISAILPCAPGAKYSGEQHILGYDYLETKVRIDIRLDEDHPKPGAEPKDAFIGQQIDII